ncbi:MAG: hypothetical protein AAGU27_12920 [Dehalobacterium sp.]
MASIPKPQNLGELKAIVNKFKGHLSAENLSTINQIIDQIEKSGGVNQSNRGNLITLMNTLASRNGVKIPPK